MVSQDKAYIKCVCGVGGGGGRGGVFRSNSKFQASSNPFLLYSPD